MRRFTYIGCAALCFLTASGASAQESGSGEAVLATNVEVRAALDRVSSKSALWRDALSSIAALGRHVLVVTPDQVVAGTATDRDDAFDPTTLGEASPVVMSDSSVQTVVVVINVELLRQTYATTGAPAEDFDADLERVLIHEVYGHAVPYLLAGSLAGRCPDPAPGERARDACSIRRENEVRSEADLGKRSNYGLGGLSIAWYMRASAMPRWR
jgi:hypothetical protein